MYLKSPDPTAHAVIGGGRLYPVREGIFQVPDDAAEQFPGYERATEIPSGVAEQLRELGSHEHIVEEPEAAAVAHSELASSSVLDAHVQQLAGELKSAIAEKDAAVAEVERLVAEAAKPFEVVGNEILDRLHIHVDHENRVITVSDAAPEPDANADGDAGDSSEQKDEADAQGDQGAKTEPKPKRSRSKKNAEAAAA